MRTRNKRPPPRSGHSQTTIDRNRIAVYGGSGKGGRKSDLWVLDMEKEVTFSGNQSVDYHLYNFVI